jgi:WD40 repeat protein
LSPIRPVVLLVSAVAVFGPAATASANHPHVGGPMAHGFAGGGIGPVFPMPVVPFQFWIPPMMGPSMQQGNWLVWGSEPTANPGEQPLGIQVPPLPERLTLRGHAGTVTCVAFSPDGSTLASGSVDKTVILWDLVNRRRGLTLQGHSSSVSSLAFSPDGSTLATASSDRTVLLWDLANNRVRSTLRGHKSEVTAVAYGPDGTTLASASRDGQIKLWDVATGRVRTTIEGRHGQVWDLVFSPDGTTLAASVFVTGVTLWDLSTAQLKAKLRAWHKSETTAVAAIFGKSTLALARGRDGTIWLQDSRGGEIPGALSGHQGAVRCMAFGPGGTMLASGGRDMSVRIWNVTEERERWDRIKRAIRQRETELAAEQKRESERKREQRERDDDR